MSSCTASGTEAPAARSFSYFSVAGQSTREFGEFLPVIALGAEVADAVAFDFIFGDELVGAVFEDEAARRFLLRGRRDSEREQQQARVAARTRFLVIAESMISFLIIVLVAGWSRMGA